MPEWCRGIPGALEDQPCVQEEVRHAAEAHLAGEPGVGHDQAPDRQPSQDQGGIHPHVHPRRLWLLFEAPEHQRQLGHNQVREPRQVGAPNFYLGKEYLKSVKDAEVNTRGGLVYSAH